jgi:hypothetical protein
MQRKTYLPKIKFKSFPALIAFFILTAFTVSLPTVDPFMDMLKQLEDYNARYPQEKVHLQLDKPYYAVGDNIWFKAYLLNTLTSTPSTISGILYVELIDSRDSIQRQLKLPVIAGISWGSFKVSDTLQEGNYRVRAYTQWMRNIGPAFFFDKTIKIGSSWVNNVFTNTQYQFSKVDNQEKVNTKIIFTDKNGEPFALKKVQYEVKLQDKTIEKGKAVTDGKGEAIIGFINSKPEIYKSGRIIATLFLPDNKRVIKEIPVVATSNHTVVQFFAEGGNLVEGLPAKVGIKSVNSSGLGEDVTGSIVDRQGNEVAKFATTHLGMGSFTFMPLPGKIYTAVVKYKDGSENKINLPLVQKTGYVMAINQSKENIMVDVYASMSLLNKGQLKLIAQHNNNVCYVLKAGNNKQVINAVVPLKNLPSGIIQFTLFSTENVPLSERLVFVNNPVRTLLTTLSSARNSYKPREEVTLDLSSTVKSTAVQGSFSIAVTNTSAIRNDEMRESNIFSTLLLTSDLEGYIEQPNYYFLNEEDKTKKDLDNLLLTQGWRRLVWKNMMAGSTPKVMFQPEKSLKISGTITTNGGKPIAKSKVTLLNSADKVFAVDTLTDAEGRFSFDELTYADNTKFIIQARTPKDRKNLTIKLDKVTGQIVTKNTNTGDIEVNVNEAISAYLKQSDSFFDDQVELGLLERTKMLKEITVVAKRNPARNSSNLNGPGNADFVIAGEQLGTCFSIIQCLEGRVAGLMFRDGIPYLARNNGIPMQVIVDGMPFDSKELLSLNMPDIQAVEVLKDVSKTALYGRGGTESGILIITSKRAGDDTFIARNTGMLSFYPKGYTMDREFYAPAYQPGKEQNIPDHRSTVYWNPNIVTSAEGKATLKFFNTGDPGIYRAVIEGFDMKGNLARAVYTYEVK